jgi:methionine--tRNA ligase beta chain
MKTISFKDFQKLDIRIGTVVDAEVPKWSHWVIKLTVDLGSAKQNGLGKKIAFAGIMKFYKPKDLIGKQFPFVVNLEPKKVGPEGNLSEVMILAASLPAESGKEREEKPVLFSLSEQVPNGTKVR